MIAEFNWPIIASLPERFEVVTGGAEFNAVAVAHLPENRHCVEALIAQDRTGTYQRLRVITSTKGKVRFGPAQWIAGNIHEIVEARKVRELKESMSSPS
jgi:hypothetical protein